MSIILRSNPLNLSFTVILLTYTPSTARLATVIAKTLLKANALVLAISTQKHDPSLTADAYSHFQFIPSSLTAEDLPDRIRQVARIAYQRDAVNVLVNIAAESDGAQTVEAVRGFGMRCDDAGLMSADGVRLVNVIDQSVDGGSAGSDSELRRAFVDMVESFGAQKKWTAAVVSKGKGMGDDNDVDERYQEAKENMRDMIKSEKAIKEAREDMAILFDTANVTLFLAGQMFEESRGHVEYTPQGVRCA